VTIGSLNNGVEVRDVAGEQEKPDHGPRSPGATVTTG